MPELVISFRDWFQKHRGAAEPTLKHYCRGASELIEALGKVELKKGLGQ